MDALPCYTAEKNISVFGIHKVLSEAELRSRRDIGLDSYAKIINIEAETMLMMVRRQIMPSVVRFAGDVAKSVQAVNSAGCALRSGEKQLSVLCAETECLDAAAAGLSSVLSGKPGTEDPGVFARYMHDRVLPAMKEVRTHADALEQITDKTYWPFPTYDELLFSVR